MIDVAHIAEELKGWFERTKTDSETFLSVHAPALEQLAEATSDDLGKLALGAAETVIPAELRPVVAELVTKFVQAYLAKPAPAPAPEPAPEPDVPADPAMGEQPAA